jgi:hypothetical protein
MKALGTFIYSAEAVPAGTRKARRVNLIGVTEIAFREIQIKDMVADAVVVDSDDLRGGREIGRVSFSGWEKRLWLPLGGIHLQSVKAENYLGSLMDPARPHFFDDIADPIRGAFDPTFAAKDSTVADLALAQREEDFAGKILLSNKTEALQRVEAASQNVIIVDGIVYTFRPEPIWRWSMWNASTHTLAKLDLDYHGREYYRDQSFRLDRLDDAMEWVCARRKNANAPATTGRVISFDPEFIKRNDISYMLAEWLPHMMSPDSLGAQLGDIAAYLPTESLLIWKSLSDIGLANGASIRKRLSNIGLASRTSILQDDVFVGDVDATIQMLRTLRDDIVAARMPTARQPVQEAILRALLNPLLDRVDFDLAKAAKPGITDSEDAAIAKFAS